MFERFTDAGRRVLALAQRQADMLEDNCVGSQHLLLGILQEDDSIAATVLESLGVTVEKVVERIRAVRPAAAPSASDLAALSSDAKKVLDLSLREALQLGHNCVDPEHILLAIIHDGEGAAAELLFSLRDDLRPGTRGQVIRTLSGIQPPPPRPSIRSTLEEVTSARAGRGFGAPLCPHCRTSLGEGTVGCRTLAVQPAGGTPRGKVEVVFVYCLTCGAVM